MQLQQKVSTGKLPADEFVRLSSLVLSGLSGSLPSTRLESKSDRGLGVCAGRAISARRTSIEEVVTSRLYPGDPRKLLPSLWLNGPAAGSEGICDADERLLQSGPSLGQLRVVIALWLWPQVDDGRIQGSSVSFRRSDRRDPDGARPSGIDARCYRLDIKRIYHSPLNPPRQGAKSCGMARNNSERP